MIEIKIFCFYTAKLRFFILYEIFEVHCTQINSIFIL